ncbi:MAG: hypothetical protein J6O55_03005 [Lachnospiraceae bacterium]|nr:hypothetical protein [Lachnospiraceae bacterium]
MEKRIFRVLMSTVLLVLLTVFIVGVVQGIFIRHSQAHYREELEKSGRTMADDYKRLTDEYLRNLTAEKAAKADRVFSECDNLIYAFRNVTLSVLSGGEGPGEGALSLPRGDAPKGKVSSYYAIPYGVDISDDKVRSDLRAFAEIAPAVESTIAPEAPIYAAVAVTMSGPVLLINSMENEAAKNMAMLNEWSEAYRSSLSEEGIADEIVLSILVPDIVNGEYCTIVGLPVFWTENPGALYPILSVSHISKSWSAKISWMNMMYAL